MFLKSECGDKNSTYSGGQKKRQHGMPTNDSKYKHIKGDRNQGTRTKITRRDGMKVTSSRKRHF